MRLKLYLLPTILQEVDSVTEVYMNLVNDLRREHDTSTLNSYLELRESIGKRIDQLDEFFEDNINDVKVFAIEKAKIRLKKLLMYDPDVVNKVESDYRKNNQYEETQYKNIAFNKTINKSPDVSRKETFNNSNAYSPKLKNKSVNFNLSSFNKDLKDSPDFAYKNKNIKNNDSFLNTENKNNKQSKNPIIKKVSNNFSNGFIASAGMTLITADLENPSKLNSFHQTIEKDSNFSDFKEIAFKIKLTEREYKLLMKEKAQNIII